MMLSRSRCWGSAIRGPSQARLHAANAHGGAIVGQAALQLSHLRRLQQALEKIATDLDEIEGRSHARLRHIAKDLNDAGPARSLESCVSNFEIAVRGRLVN